MIVRLVAIGFIFICTSVAWFVLAGVTTARTHFADTGLRQQVESVWGAPQVQQPPSVTWTERVTRNVERLEDGKKVVRVVENHVARTTPLQGSDIKVTLGLDHRQKGLLWYATYAVDFAAAYTIVNATGATRDMEIAFPFPSRNAVFDDLRFEVA